jgi:magnesium-transporting ATPase (P-type)
MEEANPMQVQREGESMISAKISEQDETGRLTAEAEPPLAIGEQTTALLLAELSPETFSQVEVQGLVAESDPVELPKRRILRPLFIFLSFFWGPVPWLIESSAVLSAVARHWEVTGIILILLLVDAYLGFWQEYQTGNIITSFKEMLP